MPKRICLDCKEEKVIHALGLCRKCYDNKNKDKILRQHREWDRNNKDKIERTNDKRRLNGMRQEVLERDNFECQRCGMSQEQHLLVFNKKLIIHHKDENGQFSDNPNHGIDNLLAVCFRCHNSLHKVRTNKPIFQGLLEQDDSDYKYPKIREILLNKKKRLGTITKAKKELANEMNLSYHTIDHLHYYRKDSHKNGGKNNG